MQLYIIKSSCQTTWYESSIRILVLFSKSMYTKQIVYQFFFSFPPETYQINTKFLHHMYVFYM